MVISRKIFLGLVPNAPLLRGSRAVTTALAVAALLALSLLTAPAGHAESPQGCRSSVAVGQAVAEGCFTRQGNLVSSRSAVVVGGFSLTPAAGETLTLDLAGGRISGQTKGLDTKWGGAEVTTDPSSFDFNKPVKVSMPDVTSIFAADDFFTDLAPAAPRDWVVSFDPDGRGSTALGKADLQYFAQRAGAAGAFIGNLTVQTGLTPQTGVSIELATTNASSAQDMPDPARFCLKFDSTNISFTGPIFGIDPTSSVAGILPVATAELHRVNSPVAGNHWQLDGTFNPELVKNNPGASDSLLSYGKTAGQWSFSIIWGKKWADGPRGFNLEVYKSSVLANITGGLGTLLLGSVGLPNPVPFGVETVGVGARFDPLGARGELGLALGPQLPGGLGSLSINPSAEIGFGAMANPLCKPTKVLDTSLAGDVFFKIPTPLTTQFVVSGVLCGTARSATIGPIVIGDGNGQLIDDPSVRVLGKAVLRVVDIKFANADVTGSIKDGAVELDLTSVAGRGPVQGTATAHLSNAGLSTVCFKPDGLASGLPGTGFAAQPGGLPYQISC